MEADSDNRSQSPVTAGAARPARQEEGLRVIFEQVLVALILAFIFRAFILEAFVTPTGSMATTLLGAHMRFRCPDCGWRFEVNYPTDATTQNIFVPRPGRVYAIRCTNCAYRLPRNNPADPVNDATDPPVLYGDRVLVLKHAYLLREPRRWEVVVFKNPSRSGVPFEGLPEWSTEPYQQNYIKRLIGLPEERIMLLDGDVYVNSDKHMPDADLLPEHFAIARKSDVAQSALWRVIYDDDHRPQGLDRSYDTDRVGRPIVDPPWQMPWKQVSGGGWSVIEASEGGGFRFEAPTGTGTLRFDGNANPHTFAFTDYLAYDINDSQLSARHLDQFSADFAQRIHPEGPIRLNRVSDLRLKLFYQRDSGQGPLLLTLSKRGDVFTARIGDGVARLEGHHADGTTMFQIEENTTVDFSRPRQIEFVNTDYRLQLRIDGRTVLETSDQDYSPDVAALLSEERRLHDDEDQGFVAPHPTVSISAADQVATLRHVSLWRDVFYTARDQRGGFYPYASPEAFPSYVIRLGEQEYFTLGDNPLLSGDARSWTDGLTLPYEGDLWVSGGRVPERFMLGRAFFVYWPAGFRPAPQLPAIVPNFGEMRFIR